MTPPSYSVRCSCGRSTILHWDSEYERYFATNPEWFAYYPAGWTCGRFGHTQQVPPRVVKRIPRAHKLKVIL